MKQARLRLTLCSLVSQSQPDPPSQTANSTTQSQQSQSGSSSERSNRNLLPPTMHNSQLVPPASGSIDADAILPTKHGLEDESTASSSQSQPEVRAPKRSSLSVDKEVRFGSEQCMDTAEMRKQQFVNSLFGSVEPSTQSRRPTPRPSESPEDAKPA